MFCSLPAQGMVAEARLPAVFIQSCLFLQPLHPVSPRNLFPGQTFHIMTKAEGHRFSQFAYSLQLFSCFNEKQEPEACDGRDKVWKAADVWPCPSSIAFSFVLYAAALQSLNTGKGWGEGEVQVSQWLKLSACRATHWLLIKATNGNWKPAAAWELGILLTAALFSTWIFALVSWDNCSQCSVFS